MNIPGGIPSVILARRRDIRRSEQELIAAHADLNVARTLYFPRIPLTGPLGYASRQIGDLLRNSANFWYAGAGDLSPVFTTGLIKGRIQAADAVQRQALDNYLKTVQNAFREVEGDLVTIKKQEEIATVEKHLLDALKERALFARKRYDARFSTYLEVLVAEKELYLAQIRHIRTRFDLLLAIVDTYRAMGGWITEAVPAAAGPMHAARPD